MADVGASRGNEECPGETTDSTLADNTTADSLRVPEVPTHVNEVEQLYQTLTSATECNSLLRKHLTQAIFDKIKDRKTSYGGTLAHCILSGSEHPESSVGIYASDPHAYDVFSDLFDPIIKDYFKLPERKSLHHVCGDLGDLNKIKLDNLDPEGKFIIKTKIQIVRSLEGFAFPPILTAQNRIEIESKTLEALNSLSDELKGTYHSLAELDEDARKEFLFNHNDRLLAAAGCYSDWPTGRGIFYNESKTFLALINEEDHLKIISEQNGADIGSVYKRIVLANKTLQEKLKFSRHHRVGFITFCPTNLATTLKASVHIQIPFLSASENFQTLCDKLKLQATDIRGVQGQGLFEISNTRRFCSTEYQLVHELCCGVKEIIKHEKELAWRPSNVEEMFKHLHKAKSCQSLLKKYLTKNIFEKLKEKNTSSHNATLGDCILSGVLNPDSVIGLYAADPESYTEFASLFEPVIKDYHKLKHSQPINQPASDYGDLENLEFADLDPDGSMIVSTRIWVSRSLQDFAFLPVLQSQDRNQLEQKCVETLNTLTGELKGNYYSLKDMSNETRENLINEHLLFNDRDRFLKAAGVYRDWPTGRGIFLNDNKTFMVWVNAEDNLKIFSVQKGGDIGSVYRKLITAMKVLEEKLTFARDNSLGFLTVCPSNLGTTLRVSVCLNIPHLSAKSSFKFICEQLKLQARGIHENSHDTSSKPGTSVFEISNKESFGLTEIELMKEMVEGVQEIIRFDKEYAKYKTRSCHVL